MSKLYLPLSTVACTLSAAVLVAADAVAGPPSVGSFFKSYAYDSMTISPNGRYLAVTYPSNDTTNSAVLDLQDRNVKALTGFKYPERIEWVHWKSDDVLVYSVTIDDRWGTRISNMGAIRRDGRYHVYLVDNRMPDNVGTWRYLIDEVVHWLPDDPDTVLMASEGERDDFPSVYRVSLRAGGEPTRVRMAGSRFPTRRVAVLSPPGRKCEFIADHKGRVRVCLTRETDGSRRLLYRPDEGSEWQQLEQTDANAKIWPTGFTDDDQALIVFSNKSRDTDALFVYEPAKRALTELIFEAPAGLDVSSASYSTYGRRFVAAGYLDHGSHVVFFEETYAKAYAALHATFPGKVTSITSMAQDGGKAVALVKGSNDPGTFYLFDIAGRRIEPIVHRAPWLKDARLGETRWITFEARDKTRIDGYLILPPGKEARNLPLIVNPHGGPIGVRDDDEFDREAQFLASRGYAVLKLNYRGSGGYGKAFRKAGFREWGKKMQDDVTDGVLWTIQQGIADKERICIFGASYGGYAAMMGLIRTPELYRCGVTFAGVSDLDMLLNARAVHSATLSRKISPEERKFWEEVIGDRNDEAGLRSLSPRYNAAAVRAPVLIAHGEDDVVVPIRHSTTLRDELRAAGKQVEYLSARNEGHGFELEKSKIALYTQLEQFLAKHLAPRETQTAASP